MQIQFIVSMREKRVADHDEERILEVITGILCTNFSVLSDKFNGRIDLIAVKDGVH